MIFCDYDSLTHYSAGEFSSKYKTDIHDALTLIEKTLILIIMMSIAF